MEKINEFISAHCSCPPQQILPSSRLYHDLNISGTDAAELINAFAREFKVDVSDFNFDNHFPSEPSILSVFDVFRDIADKIKGRPSRYEPVTVDDLARAVKSGKLINAHRSK